MKRPELEEWVESLKRGEKVPLCRPISLRTVFLALALYLFLLPLVLQVGDGKWDAEGLRHFLLFCLTWGVLAVPMWLVWPYLHLSGRNTAVRLDAEGLTHWNWRGRGQRIPWSEITSLRLVHGKSIGLAISYSRGVRRRELVLCPDGPVRGSLWNPPAVANALGEVMAPRAGLVAEKDEWGVRTPVWVRPGPEVAAQ